MTRLSTKNAKDTIIEPVIIVRRVVTHKLLQFEDVNPAVTLRPICTNPPLKLRCALSERHRSHVHSRSSAS